MLASIAVSHFGYCISEGAQQHNMASSSFASKSLLTHPEVGALVSNVRRVTEHWVFAGLE